MHCKSNYKWLRTEKIVLTVKQRYELSAIFEKGVGDRNAPQLWHRVTNHDIKTTKLS
jgi:hypothetical protein